MMKTWLSFIFFFGLSICFGQTENTWIKRASFGGLKREKAVAFSIGNMGYVSCGVDTAEITHNDLWQYDPALDSWTQLASIPGSERRNAVAFSIGNKGYVGTGFSHDDGELGTKLKDFWEYNPISNNWTAKADFPGGGDTGIYQASAFSVLDKGYIVGGKIGSNAYISELWQYNPVSDHWTAKTHFPGGDRYQLISFVLENRAYVGLGTDHDIMRKDIHEYNPVTNTWEDMPDFPGTERTQSSTFTLGAKGYLVFGSDGGLKDELWEFNYYTETWTPRAVFPGGGRKSAIALSIGNRGYAGLGKETSGKKQTFYEYIPLGLVSVLEEESITFNVYPNPIQTESTVLLPEKLTEGSYTIYNSQGQVVMQNAFNTNQIRISRSTLMNGNYHLVIYDHHKMPLGIKKIMLL